MVVLLDLIGYTADRDLGTLHLLEPSCGSGAFLGPAVERLIKSAQSEVLRVFRTGNLRLIHAAACPFRSQCRLDYFFMLRC